MHRGEQPGHLPQRPELEDRVVQGGLALEQDAAQLEHHADSPSASGMATARISPATDGSAWMMTSVSPLPSCATSTASSKPSSGPTRGIGDCGSRDHRTRSARSGSAGPGPPGSARTAPLGSGESAGGGEGTGKGRCEQQRTWTAGTVILTEEGTPTEPAACGRYRSCNRGPRISLRRNVTKLLAGRPGLSRMIDAWGPVGGRNRDPPQALAEHGPATRSAAPRVPVAPRRRRLRRPPGPCSRRRRGRRDRPARLSRYRVDPARACLPMARGDLVRRSGLPTAACRIVGEVMPDTCRKPPFPKSAPTRRARAPPGAARPRDREGDDPGLVGEQEDGLDRCSSRAAPAG